MRKQNGFLRALGYCLLTFTLVAIAAVSLPMLLGLVGGASGFTLMTAGGGVVENITTTKEVNDLSPDLNLDHVSKKITQLKPASTPLDTIMREVAHTVPINSFRTEFYTADIKPLKDSMKVAYTKNDDGSDYDAIQVNNIKTWAVDDTLLIPSVKGSDGKEFAAVVSKKENSTNKLFIMPLNGLPGSGAMAEKFIIPKNIAKDAIIVRMGSAKSELDAQTTAFSILPGKDYNYTQNYMSQISQSTFQKIHAQEVAWGWQDYEELNIYDMKARAELSYLFGFRSKKEDAEDGEERYTSHGLTRYINQELQYASAQAINNAKWIDWTKTMFASNAGSEHRFIFAGDDLLANISKNVDSVEKQISSKNVEVKWGITFNKVETNFGQLYIKRHPLLGHLGMGDQGILLDINNIEKHVFLPLSVRELDLKKPGLSNADAKVLQEVNCPVLRYGDTHAMIRAV